MAKIVRPRFLYCDVESSGLVGVTHGITQIGALVIDAETLEDIDAFDCYIKPYGKVIDQRAMDYTGLSVDFLEKEGLPVKDAYQGFTTFLQKHLPSKRPQDKHTFCAHNAKFDKQMLEPFFKENKGDFYDYFCEDSLCTWRLGIMQWGGDLEVTQFKLPILAEKANLEKTQNHDAMNDVWQGADLLKFYIRNMRNGGNSEAVEKQERFRANFKF